MGETVHVTETLRDAWQGLPRVVPTADKIAFAQRLLDLGFRSIDIGSFVSPRAVPAMADTGDVVAALHVPEGARLTALVANEKGLERLLAAPGIDEVLFPFSLSDTFQRRNTRCSRDEAARTLDVVCRDATAAGRRVYATISMAFGNDEGDPWSPEEVADWTGRLFAIGVHEVGLADTTAQADPSRVAQVLGVVVATTGRMPSLHLHATARTQQALVDASLDAGCRAFDSALGGLGGCQFARGPESNVSTLALARRLVDRGFEVALPLDRLDELDSAARALAAGA
ncbi:MAG: hydroxymethylglutaryl-CoA lyase [Planctomycetes bacterium]|nr:hydroxymethylglutaryl-CoA lyase [Planctomycetota bacterium]